MTPRLHGTSRRRTAWLPQEASHLAGLTLWSTMASGLKTAVVELAFRTQDDQPRPVSGATAAVEPAIKIRH